jgi:hypothetical protein
VGAERGELRPAGSLAQQPGKYFLPSRNKRYKAAYYDPSAGVYYNYATGSDTPPIPVSRGTIPFTAVYLQPFEFGPADNMSAGGLSPYGTIAQNGKVYEWEETGAASSTRANRGVCWFDRSTNANNLSSAVTDSFPTVARSNILGFRIASVGVPEPSLLVILAAAATFLRHSRRGMPVPGVPIQ